MLPTPNSGVDVPRSCVTFFSRLSDSLFPAETLGYPIHRVSAMDGKVEFPTAASGAASNATAMPDSNDPLITQLLALLNGGQAHATFDDAVNGLPAAKRGVVVEHLPYSAWQILEHLRIAQRDILNFSAPPTGGYHPMKWPEDYWPKSPEPPTPLAWDQTIAAIRADREKFEALLTKPSADLHKPFLWGDGQTLLREALLIADHNAYHVGELIVIRRLLGAWPAK